MNTKNMHMLQFVYQLIYQPQINYVIRNFNKFLLSILPLKLKIPPSGILFLNTNSGIIKIKTNQTSYLTQLLFWQGYANFEYSEIFEKLCKKNIHTFLDIGSNIGYYSLLGAKANKNLKVFAFEPAAGPKHYLKKNINLNKFNNQIKHVDLALSKKKGEIVFYEVGNKKYRYLKYNLAGEGNAGTKTKTRNFQKTKVNSDTLNNFILNHDLRNVDLIKLDTEGTEMDILNHGIASIEKMKPIVICETLYNTIEKDLENYFKNLGYDLFNHYPSGLKKVETLKRSYDDQVRNCFFVPPSKFHLIKEFVK